MKLPARRRRWTALALALLLFAAVLHASVATRPAAAAGPCAGIRSNYFDGYYQPGRNYAYEGASAYMVVRDGKVCTGIRDIGNFTNAWVMIAGNLGADYNGWGQVGFERTSGFPLRWFSQFYDGYNSLETRYSTFSVNTQAGVRHAFRTLWNESCRCLQATIDSTTWAVSSFNPFAYPAESNWGPQPWSPQFLAETGYLQADVPGLAASPTRWSAVGVQRVSDDRLQLVPCILSGANDNPTRWKRRASSCTSFDVWTG